MLDAVGCHALQKLGTGGAVSKEARCWQSHTSQEPSAEESCALHCLPGEKEATCGSGACQDSTLARKKTRIFQYSPEPSTDKA